MGLHAAILLDLQGPKIRLGMFCGWRLSTRHRRGVHDQHDRSPGHSRAWLPRFTNRSRATSKPGDCVKLADGAVELKVIATDGVAARCRVVSGGFIKDKQGINLPGVQVSAPSLTLKDEADLEFGVKAGVDFVALSFVRSARRSQIPAHAAASIGRAHSHYFQDRKPEGWRNLDAILAESDGVMVARGDLGVEIALERVPEIQKGIIERARYFGKIVITATQMLESMIENSHPYARRSQRCGQRHL